VYLKIQQVHYTSKNKNKEF